MALRSLNKVSLLGTLGKDPQTGTTKNGNPWARFSIATSEEFKNKQTQEWESKTEWHNISTFNERICKLMQYLHKGSRVYLEGQMKTKKFTDDQGVERYNTEVEIPMFGGELVLLDKKEDGQRKAAASPAKQQAQSNSQDDDLGDEIPW